MTAPSAVNARRPKVAIYWGASCGGCEVSFLNLDHYLPEFSSRLDLVFCPCLLDRKRADLEALPDRTIDLALLNGAVRNTENLEMFRLLRRKSRFVVACGSCAESGGIPALANQAPLDALLERVYRKDLDPGQVPPGLQARRLVPEGFLELPGLLGSVHPLSRAVAVDYLLPGCPPEPESFMALFKAVARTPGKLPDPDAVSPDRGKAVCDCCPQRMRDVSARALRRTMSVVPEPEWCLMEQGMVCLGKATRGGCGALCPTVGMPCTGCYGPLDPDGDPVAAALASVAAMVAPELSPSARGEDVELTYRRALAALPDPLGGLHRFGGAAAAPAAPPEDET